MKSNYYVPDKVAVAVMQNLLGNRFLSYVLNLQDSEDVERYLLEMHPEKIDEIFQLVLAVLDVPLSDPMLEPYERLFGQVQQTGFTRADEIRVKNGGSVYRPPNTDDLILKELYDAIPRILPAMFIDYRSAREPNPRLFITAIEPFITGAITADQHIRESPHAMSLFSQADLDVDYDLSCQQFVMLFTVPGQLNFFPQQIESMMLQDGVFRAGLIGEHTNGYAIAEKSKESLDDYRSALNGDTVLVPAVAFLSGCSIQSGESIIAGDKMLREPTSFEQNYILQNESESYIAVQFKYPFRLVAYGELAEDPLQNSNSILGFFDRDCSKVFMEEQEYSDCLKNELHCIECMRLALLLASDEKGGDSYITRFSGYHISSPVSATFNPISINQQFLGNGAQVGKDDESSIDLWYGAIICSELEDGLVRRILQGFAERDYAEDSIIDILIAIESLLGTNTEIANGISTSMAWLIEPSNSDKRLEVYKSFKDIYNVRSKIVHGSKPKKNNYYETAEQLKVYMLAALKKLLTTHNYLLQMKQSERSKALMLNLEYN